MSWFSLVSGLLVLNGYELGLVPKKEAANAKQGQRCREETEKAPTKQNEAGTKEGIANSCDVIDGVGVPLVGYYLFDLSGPCPGRGLYSIPSPP